MSKFVKNLIVDQIKKELAEVEDCVLVNVIGLDAGESGQLRDRLHEKNINIRVVKKSLAVRATEGTSLAPVLQRHPEVLPSVGVAVISSQWSKSLSALTKTKITLKRSPLAVECWTVKP